MDPAPEGAAPPRRPPTAFFFASGLFTGALLGLVGFSALGYVLVRQREATVRCGWNLVPVVVIAADVREGEALHLEALSQRAVPEQFVTASVVKPDSASYVVGQKARRPLAAGEPLRWDDLVRLDPGCVERVERAAGALGGDASSATWQVLGAVKRRSPRGGGTP